MAQPHKGRRRQVAARMPEPLVDQVVAYAAAEHMSISEAVADLVATALGSERPSETLPRPKSKQRQREELSLGLTA